MGDLELKSSSIVDYTINLGQIVVFWQDFRYFGEIFTGFTEFAAGGGTEPNA